jgi:hypothetical protein
MAKRGMSWLKLGQIKDLCDLLSMHGTINILHKFMSKIQGPKFKKDE